MAIIDYKSRNYRSNINAAQQVVTLLKIAHLKLLI